MNISSLVLVDSSVWIDFFKTGDTQITSAELANPRFHRCFAAFGAFERVLQRKS